MRHSWLHSRVHIHTRLHALIHTWLHSLPVLLSRIHVHSRVHVHSWILCYSINRYLLVRILRILSTVALLLIIIVRIVCHIIKLIILIYFIIIYFLWSFSMTFRKKSLNKFHIKLIKENLNSIYKRRPKSTLHNYERRNHFWYNYPFFNIKKINKIKLNSN